MKATTHGGLTRLQLGMVIEMSGVRYRVDMVNDCRARCVPLDKVKVQVEDKLKGVTKEFERFGSSINISPNSECDIISRQ